MPLFRPHRDVTHLFRLTCTFEISNPPPSRPTARVSRATPGRENGARVRTTIPRASNSPNTRLSAHINISVCFEPIPRPPSQLGNPTRKLNGPAGFRRTSRPQRSRPPGHPPAPTESGIARDTRRRGCARVRTSTTKTSNSMRRRPHPQEHGRWLEFAKCAAHASCGSSPIFAVRE